MMRITHNTRNKKYKTRCGGFTILYAILLTTVVLSIGLSLLSLLTQQVSLSGAERESTLSFYVADAGMECALYWDTRVNAFVDGVSISCDGIDIAPSGPVVSDPSPPEPPFKNWEYTFTADFQNGCAILTVIKTVDPTDPLNIRVATTTIQSRGYNTVCPPTASTKPWRLERGLQATY